MIFKYIEAFSANGNNKSIPIICNTLRCEEISYAGFRYICSNDWEGFFMSCCFDLHLVFSLDLQESH